MMASASPSPKSPEISEKSKKYDRQLRLWGDHGQSRLENSHICLINANATGTEMLKSLVLPGCGNFTVVDGHEVTQEDLGNNFFLDSESLGKNRAAATTRLILELNSDVNGEAIEEHPDTILKQNPSFFNIFSVVVGSLLSEKTLTTLSKILWENNVPFVYMHCIGFIGWIRLQVTEHVIIESHPDSTKEDLRLDVPFPELIAHMDSVSSGKKEPWLVLLYKAVQSYMQSKAGSCVNGGGMDTTETHPCYMRDKKEFKEYLSAYLLGLGLEIMDDGYEETIKAVNKALSPTSIPREVDAILRDPKALKPESSKFWVMCAALKEFVRENNGLLPLRGTIPDMTADSQKYIALQNAYREKAAKDAEDILDRCQQHIQETSPQRITLKADEVRLFCKEVNNLRLIRGQPFYQELESCPNAILMDLAENMEDCDPDKMYYVMLRGVLRFHSEYNTYPGLLDNDVEPDIARFKSCLNKMLTEWNSSTAPVKEDFIHEICRYGAAEIPSVAAFIGGCAAHEVIKLVTSQYVPLNHSLIYNAINSTTSTFDTIS